MTLQCQVTSAWHVEVRAARSSTCDQSETVSHIPPISLQVEPEGCIVNIIEYIQDSHLVLCGYSPGPAAGTTSTGGVLVVDSRDGEVKRNVCLTADVSDDAVIHMNAENASDLEYAITCVTTRGSVWQFTITTEASGNAIEIKDKGRSAALLEALGSEDSPMEDTVLASQLDSIAVSGSTNGRSEEPVDITLPAFISENGFRGVKEGYTYWDPEKENFIDQDASGMSEKGHRRGYYRNDVMKGILKKQRDQQRAGSRPPAKKILRCFTRLRKASKYVASSHDPNDGMIYVGEMTPDLSVVTCSDGPLLGHMSGVLAITASPDERYLASGSYDQTIRIWDTTTWSCLKILKGHGGGIKCLTFSGDGSLLISAASDNTTRVWSTKTWLCMRHLHGRHEDTTWPVCMDLQEGVVREQQEKAIYLVSGSNGFFGGSTIKIFDVSSGECLVTFAQLRYDHKGSCSAVCMALDGRQVITAATDASIAGWDCSFSVEKKQPLLTGGFFK
jgi:WD40 repeat protein